MQLRQERSQSQGASEVREGTTYESACDLQPTTRGRESLYTKEIPEGITIPSLQYVTTSALESTTLIVADVETTDTSYDAQLTQLSAAMLARTEETFSACILPSPEISKQATAVTRIAKARRSGNTVLSINI